MDGVRLLRRLPKQIKGRITYLEVERTGDLCMVPSSGRLPPPHGMVQVGVQGQGRGMPLQPHH